MNLPIQFSGIKLGILIIIISVLISLLISFKGHRRRKPLIVWWTPFTNERNKQVICDLGSCLISEDRHSPTGKNPDAFIFYGSSWTIDDLPLERNGEVLWALLHEESPKNQPIFNHKDVLSLFNVSSTFKQSSNMPLTLQYLRNLDSLISQDTFTSSDSKNEFLKNRAPIMYIQSDCDPPSERDNFVMELGKYIEIDSYGRCLNNKKLPDHMIGIETFLDRDLLKLISTYKFTLSLENYSCEDYITEKLWRPLIAGSIPIYWGAPNVDEWLPNKPSIINVRDYSSAKELAEFLKQLLREKSLYEAFLTHKIHRTISNTKLSERITARRWGVQEDQISKGTFVEHFECFVCDHLLRNLDQPSTQTVDVTHYGCPLPKTVMGGKPKSTFWTDQWRLGKAEGRTLFNMMQRPGIKFDYATYVQELSLYLEESNYLLYQPHEN